MDSQNKKIAFNSVVIFARLCVVSVVSLLSARFVLQALGVSDYGLYNVVGGLVNLLNILNAAMISTTYRYIAFELGRGGNVNEVFNVSFSIHCLLAIIIAIVGLILGGWYVETYLNIPEGSLGDARFVLLISVLTAMLTTMLVPFQGLMTAYEKFQVTAVFDIVSQLIRLGAVVALIYIPYNKIRTYSIIMLAYNILYAGMFYLYSIRKYREIIRFHLYKSKKLYKEMLSFSGWILCGASANVGQVQGSSMIINYFFGTIANAAFAVANQVHNFVSMFAGNLGQAAVPQITKNFSGGNENRSIMLACYISKYTYILMALVTFPLILEIDFILSIWLKEVPDGAGTMCVLTLVNGIISCLGAGTPALIQATGKIKLFQIILSTLSLLSLPIAFICYKMGAPVYSILIVYCFISSLIAVVRIVLLKRVLNFDIKQFLNISYIKIFKITIPLIIFYFLYNSSNFSFLGHLLGLFCSLVYFVIVVLVLGLDNKEQGVIISFLKQKSFTKR